MRFVGDVHGWWDEYVHVIKETEFSIQVGDFGMGFKGLDYQALNGLPLGHRFLRGNHDSPERCKADPHWIPDGEYYRGVFCVGGGFSRDWAFRTEGKSWWRDEELSVSEMERIFDIYVKDKPKYVASHECPAEFLEMFRYPEVQVSSTGKFLQSLLEAHRPELWVFGHHHSTMHRNFGSTEAICLGELSHIDIDLEV